MDAMSYEYLLRRVYHCGRGGVKGADADIYRKLEHAATYLDDSNMKGTKEKKQQDYFNAFAEVKMYVRNALREGIRQVKHRTTKSEFTKLEAMEEEVHSIKFYDKTGLDEIIEEADDIFRKYGLEAR